MRELNIEIIPAVLPKDYEDLREHLERVRSVTRVVQIDVCDGVFTNSKTWPYVRDKEGMFEKILKGDEGLPFWEDFDFEVDLMVSNPRETLENWITAGATRAIIHEASIEDKDELAHLIATTKAEGRIDIGLAITSSTDLDTLDPYISDLDVVQCMGIARVGFQGEPFDQAILSTITRLRERYPHLILSVDGAVTFESAAHLVNAGATRLVSGSTIFNSVDIRETIHLLKGGVDFDDGE